MRPTFVYGTLMAEEVIQGLIGRVPTMLSPALLPGYSRWSVGMYDTIAFVVFVMVQAFEIQITFFFIKSSKLILPLFNANS